MGYLQSKRKEITNNFGWVHLYKSEEIRGHWTSDIYCGNNLNLFKIN